MNSKITAYTIRPIESRDNSAVEYIIRYCLTEFGANHEGTAWADPDLGRFFEKYQGEGRKYWVAEDENGQVVAGVGIGELPGAPGVCELQKMYCLPQARGVGVAYELLQLALDYARQYYEKCYLETLGNMTVAQKFYEKHGFVQIYEPVGATGHYACDVLYIRDLA